MPVGDTTNYLYGTNFINDAVAAAIAANPGDPNAAATATAQAKQDLQMCYYGGQCTFAKYDPLRGDPFFQLDLRLAKDIKFGDRFKVQLIGQAFNLTNRANYGNNFNNSIGDPASFGHPSGFINPAVTTIPRSLWGEFGVRFTF